MVVSNTRGASERRVVKDINEREAEWAGRCKVFHDLQDRTLSTRLDIDVVNRRECWGLLVMLCILRWLPTGGEAGEKRHKPAAGKAPLESDEHIILE